MNDLEKITLDNGLKVFLLPDNDKHTTFINLIVKFGGINSEFKFNKKHYRIPNGSAHFLEHLVLEKSQYGDLMQVFGSKGIRSNGLTNLNTTRFFIDMVEDIYDNLEILLNGIHSPIINKKNIDDIKGPIIEEKRRSLDNKYSNLYNKSLSSIMDNKNFDSILGSFKEIEQIDSNIINLCFKAFYRPQNETLVIGGRFDKEKIKEKIIEIYNKINFSNNELDILIPKHKISVHKKKEFIKTNTGINRVLFTFKLDTLLFTPYDKILLDGYLYTFLDTNFGSISKFNKDLKDDNVITNNIMYSSDMCEGYNIIRIEADTFEIKVFSDKVINFFKNKEYVFDKEIYELNNRLSIINMISRKDSIYLTIEPLIDNIFTYDYEELDKIEDIENDTFDKYKNAINKIDFSNYNISILEQI